MIDETLSDLDLKSLIAVSDCFVSLHRSEGWGFALCEAMSLGKPVIATAYSGNMDYCNEDTAKLIAYDLIDVRAGDYPHWEGQHWADPDIEAATQAMVELVDDPDAARALGQRARTNLSLNFSHLAIGLRYAERLKCLEARDLGKDVILRTRPIRVPVPSDLQITLEAPMPTDKIARSSARNRKSAARNPA